MTWQERWGASMMDNYGPPKVMLARGSGARVWDVDGNEYVDLIAGIAVNALGHGDPRVMAAITMMPVIAVFSSVVALVGAYVLTNFMFDFSLSTFFTSVQTFFNLGEIARGLLKSLVFGGFTALIGVHVGFRTEGGAEGVGNSTVRAFTISAASILVIDALFGVIL